MADNTVTLILDGDVQIDAFRRAVDAFTELVNALAGQIAPNRIRWVLDDLQYSSAVATVRAEGYAADVQNVVMAYAEVGASLETRTPSAFGTKVNRAADKLYDIGVERVRLETAQREAIIPARQDDLAPVASLLNAAPGLQIVRGRKPALGAIKGRIQTLTNRGGLRFTLFDLHQDKAVSCYFADGKQDAVRDLWGRLALVEGMITRDPVSGRPLVIRDVQDIVSLPEPSGRKDYLQAMGAAPSLSGLSSEEAIRRVRDAQ